MHIIGACKCVWVSVRVHSPDWELAGCWPNLSWFHFSFTAHKLPQGTCFLSSSLFFFPSSRSPPSIYLVIIATWIISDREELSFENKLPLQEPGRGRETLFWFPQLKQLITSTPCVTVFTFWVISVGNSIWGGQGTRDALCREKAVTLYSFSNKKYRSPYV